MSQKNGGDPLVSRSVTRALVLLFAGATLGGACLISQGPLPGDIALTRALQGGFGSSPAWAEFVTSTAKAPIVWMTLLLAAGLGFLGGGARGSAVPVLGFVGVRILDASLRALVHAPKPSPELISVASASTASGFPSTFGLVHGALFGGVLVVHASSIEARQRGIRVLVILASVGVLVSGAVARIVLGGHWASQLLASWLLAFSLVLALRAALGRAGPRPPEGGGPRGGEPDDPDRDSDPGPDPDPAGRGATEGVPSR